MTIRTLIASTAVSLLAACTAATAADLPARRAPPVFVPPPTFTWTGLYLGGFAGYHFDDVRVNDLTGAGQSPLLKKDGFTAGGLAGFNYQISQIVLGIEGEVGYTDFSASQGFFNNAVPPLASVASERADIEGRIRGRVGFAVGSFGFGNALLYAAGGASFLDHKLTLSNALGASSISRDRLGYNIGGGVEVAVTPNWIVRAEYIYDDYGTKLYPFFQVPGPFGNRSVHITDNTVRGAIEYKFDFAAPAAVVAKY